MDSQIPELEISLDPQPIQNFNGLSSHEIMSRLLKMGYQTFFLKGVFLDEFSDGIFLFIEEDIQFLIDDYLYIEKLITMQEPYEDGLYLNDGLLSFTATSNRTMVEMEFRYCSGLDVGNLVTHHIVATENEYIMWWRNIAHQIFSLLSSGNPR